MSLQFMLLLLLLASVAAMTWVEARGLVDRRLVSVKVSVCLLSAGSMKQSRGLVWVTVYFFFFLPKKVQQVI